MVMYVYMYIWDILRDNEFNDRITFVLNKEMCVMLPQLCSKVEVYTYSKWKKVPISI